MGTLTNPLHTVTINLAVADTGASDAASFSRADSLVISMPLEYHLRLRMSLNVNADQPLLSASIRSGPGFSAVYIDGDKHPVSITVGRQELVPLHFSEHQGMYIAAKAVPGATRGLENPNDCGEDGENVVRARLPCLTLHASIEDEDENGEEGELPLETEQVLAAHELADDPVLGPATADVEKGPRSCGLLRDCSSNTTTSRPTWCKMAPPTA